MPTISNFEFLKQHDELLFKLAETAERCFVPDPNTTLVKMRQLGEALAQDISLPGSASPSIAQLNKSTY